MNLYTWEIGTGGEDTVSTLASNAESAAAIILADSFPILDTVRYNLLKSYLESAPVSHAKHDVFYSFNSDQVCVEEAKDWIV